MPNISMTVPEVNANVSRPVILGIVRELFEITKISPNTPIYYPGGEESVAQMGSTLSEQGNERDNTRLAFDTNVQISAVESNSEGSILSTVVTQSSQIPVFHDNDVGVTIKPAYSVTNVEITFKYSSSSKTAVERWRDDIRMRVSMTRDVNLHKVAYHYPIPEVFVEILKEIHRCREAVAPYGQDLSTYLQAHATTRMTSVTSLSGEASNLSVAETQTRIQGLFDFEYETEKPERDGEASNWSISFTYKFRYDKPLFCNMRYPCMVHNQILDNRFIPQTESTNYDHVQLSFSGSARDLYHFEAPTQLARYVDYTKPVRLPFFDEFIPDTKVNSTEAFFIALCSVDEEQPKLVLNLNDLDTYELDADVLAFIKAVEWKFITKPFQSILNVSLYRSMSLTSHQELSVDADLNVLSQNDLSLRLPHRCRLSLVKDITLLSKESLKRLRQYPAAGKKLLKAIGVTKEDIELVYSKADLSNLVPELSITPRPWAMRTVNISYVVAMRLDGEELPPNRTRG